MLPFVCMKAIESKTIKLETRCNYSDAFPYSEFSLH